MGTGSHSNRSALPIAVAVRDVMDKVVAIESSQPVSEAIDKMVKANAFSLLVEKNGLPVGVVTDRDILRSFAATRHYPDKMAVEEIMHSPIITIESTARVGEALKTMVDKKVRRLYVTEGGKIIGRVTHSEVAKTLVEVLIDVNDIVHQL
jgi:CBS domain-containing protein